MIKKHLLLAAIIASSILIPAAVRADGIRIQIGDRPFYSHGDRYWNRGYEMVWMPGHMSRSGHWIHGQYVRTQRRHLDRQFDRQFDRQRMDDQQFRQEEYRGDYRR